ncbi:MAG: hypothetical protein ACRC0V_04145, partial [Fusobacteriaceae bacterium]
MKKHILKIITLFFAINFFIIAAEQNIGVIINKKFDKTLIEKLRAEIKNEFSGSSINASIEEVIFSDSKSLQGNIDSMNKNKKIDAIFVLDSNSKLLSLKSKKTLIFPFGLEYYSAIPKNFIYISGELEIDKDLKLLKEAGSIKNIAFFISSYTVSKYPKFINTLKTSATKNNLQPTFVPVESEIQTIISSIEKNDAIYIISNQEIISIIELAAAKNKLSFVVSPDNINISSALMGYDFSSEIEKRLRAGVQNYSNSLQGRGKYSVFSMGKVSENRFFNLEVANKINITPSKTFLSNFIKVISIKEKNSPLLQLET